MELIDDITISKSQYANILKLCYGGYSIAGDLAKFNRVKTRFSNYQDLDFTKRTILLNDLIILKNVFDIKCMVRVMLSILDTEHWSPFITLASLIEQLPDEMLIDGERTNIRQYVNMNHVREFTHD